METQITESMPGTNLFPEYANLHDLIMAEVKGISDEQLDWESEQWGWSRWSIRRQLSHMAFAFYVHLVRRWGEVLFPNGEHGIEDILGLCGPNEGLRLDPDKYWETPVILAKLQEAFELLHKVLRDRNVGFLRRHYLAYNLNVMGNSEWIKIHPSGIYHAPNNPNEGAMNLEANIRHVYFEETTHLYNIQRLKRAQGLPAVVEIPSFGYWMLEEWDSSEPC